MGISVAVRAAFVTIIAAVVTFIAGVVERTGAGRGAG